MVYKLLLCLLFPGFVWAQHTFSIVAIDTLSGKIGSAGATCLDSSTPGIDEGALVISDIVLKTGAIHTQAWWNPENQKNARARIQQGETADDIIAWLIKNDDKTDGQTLSKRQYGIVSLTNGKLYSAAYTGTENMSEAGHLTGLNYSIQGNILLDKQVLLDMESAFLNTKGPLGDRLMAVMNAAKRPGADSRCLSSNVSSLSAFLRVAYPEDIYSNYGELSLDINVGIVPKGIDPIDQLQEEYNQWKAAKKD